MHINFNLIFTIANSLRMMNEICIIKMTLRLTSLIHVFFFE